MKRVISALLILIMLFGLLSGVASADSSLTCASFIDDPDSRAYIDTMLAYYIDEYDSLRDSLDRGKSVIFMFEGGSDNYASDPSYTTYSSDVRNQAVVIVVQKIGGRDQIVFWNDNSSSIPSQPWDTDGGAYDRQTTLMDGIYRVQTTNHNGYYGALNVIADTGYYTPSYDPDGWENGANGINIHTRTSNQAAYMDGAWSWGCQLISSGNSSGNDFNNFMKAVTGIGYNVWNSYKSDLNCVTAGIDVGYYVLDRQLAYEGLLDIYTEYALDNITAFSREAASQAGRMTNTKSGTYQTYTMADAQLLSAIANKKYDGYNCTSMQGMNVGTTYIYTAKINSSDGGDTPLGTSARAVITRTKADSGANTVMRVFDQSGREISPNVFGHANELSVCLYGDYNYLFAAAGGGKGLARCRIDGDSLYFTGYFRMRDAASGSLFDPTSMACVKCEGGYFYFLIRTGMQFYYCRFRADAPGSIDGDIVDCYKVFSIDTRNAVFNFGRTQETIDHLEDWTNQGIGYLYAEDAVYVPLWNNTGDSGSGLENVILIYPNISKYLSAVNFSAPAQTANPLIFPCTKTCYLKGNSDWESFEIESCGYRTGANQSDKKMYFNANCFEEAYEGVFSLDCLRGEPLVSIVNDQSVIYTVKYDANGGSGSMDASTHIEGISARLRENHFTKNGYTFEGWYLSRKSDGKSLYVGPDGELHWYIPGQAPTGAYRALYEDERKVSELTDVNGDVITLTAQWRPNNTGSTRFHIEYESRGGTGVMQQQTVTYGVETVLRKNAFTKAGKYFWGWYAFRRSDETWLFDTSNGCAWETFADGMENGDTLSVYEDECTVAKTSSVNGDVITMYAIWGDTPQQTVQPSKDPNAVSFGIDVSFAQGKINWAQTASDVDFAILRAGFGDDLTSQDDTQFYANANGCTAYGVPFGVYLYSYAITDAQAQSEAEHVLRLIEGYDLSLPVFLDLEDASILNACSKADILRHAQIFCRTIEQAGYSAGIYANLNWWNNYLTSPEYDSWYRWVAQYNSTCQYSGDYCAWQYGDDGIVSGINHVVDVNYWYGSFGEKTVSGDPAISIEGASIPKSITEGSAFSVTGTVSSGLPLRKVCISVLDCYGNALLSKSVTPNKIGYDLKNADNDLLFDSLDAGVYLYQVTADNDAGSQRLIYTTFTVLSKTRTIPDDRYAIRLFTDTSLSIEPGAHKDTAGVTLCLSKDAPCNYQVFSVSYVSDGYYRLKNEATGLYLDVTGAATADRTRIELWSGNSTTAQLFQILPVGNGYMLIPKCCPSSAVDVDGELADGSELELWPANLTAHQRFTLERTNLHFHTYVYQTDVTPTKEKTGELRATCAGCGDVFTVELPKLNTTDYVCTVTKEATCTASGTATYTLKDTSYGTRTYTSVFPAVSHSYTSETILPTCTENGYTTYTCTVCGDSYTAAQIEAKGHTYSAQHIDATCTTPEKIVYTCKDCGDRYTQNVGSAKSHKYTDEVTAPTCTENGYTTYTCTVCGDSYTAAQIAAKGHTYSAQHIDATCTTPEKIVYTCKVCGSSYTVCVNSAKGHRYSAKVTAPTCTENGYTTYTCMICGYCYIADETKQLFHKYITETLKEPTCTEQGLCKYTCKRCGKTFNKYIPVVEHNYLVEHINATCTSPEKLIYTCKDCGSSDTVNIGSARSHSYTAKVTAPTCTENGYTTYTCVTCGYCYTADETKQLFHKYITETLTEPTCTEQGLCKYTCKRCGKTFNKYIPVTEAVPLSCSDTFYYADGDDSDFSGTFYYRDSYFADAAQCYNGHLATMSLCFAMSAFNSNAHKEARQFNAQDLLQKCGFTDISWTDTYNTKPTNNSIACIVGRKIVRVSDAYGSENYTLIAVAVRGGGYGAEWSGNFNLGQSGNHQGWTISSGTVLEYIRQYIANNDITGKLKLWITGYSRGAATANLLAGRIVNKELDGSGYSISSIDTYAYCFEAPAGADMSNDPRNTKYNNIHNIINHADIVTKVAPGAYGFTRYGVDYVLPSMGVDSDYSVRQTQMLRKLATIQNCNNGTYYVDNFRKYELNLAGVQAVDVGIASQSAFLNDFLFYFCQEIQNRENYAQAYQTLLCKAAGIFFGMDAKQKDAVKEQFLSNLNAKAAWIVAAAAGKDLTAAGNLIAEALTDALYTCGEEVLLPAEISSIASSAASILSALAVKHPNETLTLLKNLKGIANAHYPTVCLAWLESEDSFYN